MTDQSIIEQLEKIKEEICDKYCKWPQLYLESIKDPDDAHEIMMEHKCAKCPLQRL